MVLILAFTLQHHGDEIVKGGYIPFSQHFALKIDNIPVGELDQGMTIF